MGVIITVYVQAIMNKNKDWQQEKYRISLERQESITISGMQLCYVFKVAKDYELYMCMCNI